MAARRVTKSAIDWTKFMEVVPKNELANFQAFKAKSENYLRAMYALPENPPAIDFSVYKQRLPSPQLVDEFEQKYKALKIPYPTDQESIQKIEAQAKRDEETVKQEIQQSKVRVEKHKSRIADMKKQVPIEHMTMEDYWLAYPENAFNPKNPTFYPHTKEFQDAFEAAQREEKTQKH
ncbi:ATP synthase subunit d [Tropilaelaps mercedesae]|uniref:ATP synthase subunit d, mitochondrial n=1 Tax=Tropilaelaps mercedesae TaxID=418985 RepID=A0A1V9Y2D3_9ACAR|nr:ATP synthase subunit d [Tropilaelaps mercedesae]